MSDTATATPTYDELARVYRPIFDAIAAGAVDRELHRQLAHEPIAQLREAGFGALRVPVEYGGRGVPITDLFRLLIELGEADSNLPQALRAHFGVTEEYLRADPSPARDRWLGRIAAGAIIGNATTETDGELGRIRTHITGDETWRVTGSKHYSTGSLYADWIAVLARRDEERIGFALVDARSPGLELVDDWAGFGQRLTASGTTRLDGVPVDPADVLWRQADAPSYQIAFYQLFHLATLSGIGNAVVRDAVAYVRGRTRVFSHGSGTTAAEDPLVQQVIGRLSAAAFAAEATTLRAVGYLDAIDHRRRLGEPVPKDSYDEAEIATAKAHATVADTVLAATNLLFEAGGASSIDGGKALDRHWRNARALAVHNPVIYKQQALGAHLLTGAEPTYLWQVGTTPPANGEGPQRRQTP